MRKEDILDKAKQLISNDRIQHYGTPTENFNRIATMWSAVFGHNVSPAQVALCMVMLKATRLIQTPNHEDSWVDLAGYAACGAEVSEDPKSRPEKMESPPRIFDRTYLAKVRDAEPGAGNPNMWGVT